MKKSKINPKLNVDLKQTKAATVNEMLKTNSFYSELFNEKTRKKIQEETKNLKNKKPDNIWQCKTITIHIKKGTPISQVIDKFYDLNKENINLKIPEDINFSFSELTIDEINQHYENH